jgi:hypothetical protein
VIVVCFSVPHGEQMSQIQNYMSRRDGVRVSTAGKRFRREETKPFATDAARTNFRRLLHE